ncbi:MAG: thioredoxin-disulfide reductase [Candidatus Thermoplasmatota archaeon]|nr:thioredoxin-disulfide reductase [Candidatus Thermoplasmatota archaeon]
MDLAVIGAGPAGLASGIYAGRFGLNAVIFDEKISGGLVNLTPVVENYPGFEKISGMELMEKMRKQSEKYCEIHETEKVEKIVVDKEIEIVTTKKIYESKALVFASGTEKRKIGVKGEKEFLGKGVSYCATCDGPFFRNKKTVVIGGGNAAVIEALHLKNLDSDVSLIHRRNELRADKILQNQVFEKGINIIWDSVVEEIFGDNIVKGIRIKNVKDNIIKNVDIDGVFVSIGEKPNSILAKGIGVKTDEKGYITVDRNQRTNISKIYAAGDITGGLRQVVTACAEGAVAAKSAYEDLL